MEGQRGGKARWSHLAGDVERIDPAAGRALQAVLAEHETPLRIRVDGRAGVGREDVESAVRTSCTDETVIAGAVDVPRRPRPDSFRDADADADVVVYVLPRRLDPAVPHPADVEALGVVDFRRVILVVAGATVEETGTSAAAHGFPLERAVAFSPRGPNAELSERLADRMVVARRLRGEELLRTVARIPACPVARDIVERALDAVPADVAAVTVR